MGGRDARADHLELLPASGPAASQTWLRLPPPLHPGRHRPAGLDLRIGVHIAECEIHEGKLAGLAVATGARIAAAAGTGEMLLSSTVRDLVAGSGLPFIDRGERELKGVPGSWRLYAAS